MVPEGGIPLIRIFRPKPFTIPSSGLESSNLFDERSFYKAFERDLANANREVIIESPFMTVGRLRSLKTIMESLVSRRVKVVVVTKHPSELIDSLGEQLEAGIQYFEKLGVQVLLCKDHHRKLVMIDRCILWEGSLNILSQNRSREFMRRIDSKRMTEEMFSFLRYDRLEWFK